MQIMAAQWLGSGPTLGRVDINHDEDVDFVDFSKVAGQWMDNNNP
jgi:hypothetical protein